MKILIRNVSLGLFLLLILNQCVSKQEKGRSTVSFGKDWKFQLGDVPGAEAVGFADASWRKLNVPHDWSIEGEFSEKNPATPGGGALPGGIGWYRKSFKVSAEDLSGSVFIDFDGVYQNSEVWINGHSLGKRFYDTTMSNRPSNIAVKDEIMSQRTRSHPGPGATCGRVKT